MNKTVTQTKENISLNVDNTQEELSAAFKIPETRRDDLCEVINKAYQDSNMTNLPDKMNSIASQTTNHNELAWTMFIFGTHIALQQGNPLQSLMAALENTDLEEGEEFGD